MYSNLFVCLMGIGTVFFGLICIILLSKAMSGVCTSTQRKHAASAPAAVQQTEPADRQSLVAAVSAALAEEMGTGVSGIRILSMRKI